MAYIGTEPAKGFALTTKQSFSGDASTVAFTLTRAAGSATDLEVFVDNVQQEPTTAFGVAGTTLTFTAAPSSGTNNIYVVHREGGAEATLPIAGSGFAFKSDDAVLTFGSDSDITLTHVPDQGLILNGSYQTSSAGTSNFRAGVNAGNSIASGGNYNVVVGDEAGTALTTGDNNVAVGFEALSTEDANGNNVAVGYRSLKTLNAGAAGYTTAVGLDSGTSLTTGVRNTIMGAFAGDALTDADFNTAIGYAALTGDTQGSKSTAVGYEALLTQNFSTATDSHNTAVGYRAGTAVTTGINNTFVGFEAGHGTTDADNNTAVGRRALYTNVLGGRSTAIGHNSLHNQNPATAADLYNTAVGFEAGVLVTTGESNNIVGGLSGDALTVGSYNNVLGTSALSADTKGSRSIAIGHGALLVQNFTTATDTYNTAIGHNAGIAVTTGVTNTLIGGLAGDAINTANNNVFIGYEAGGQTTTAGGGVYIGYKAGNAMTTNGSSVFIGYNSGETCTAGNNTMVGYRSGEDLEGGNFNAFYGFDVGKETINGFSNAFFGANTALTNTNGDKNCIFGSLSDTAAADANSANGLGYDLNCVAGYTTLGDTGDDIRAAHGNTTWATVSDRRVKKDIETSTAGLDIINELRPVTFNYRAKGDLPESFRGYEKDSTEAYRSEKTQHGFIAQEVKEVIDAHSNLKDGFSLWSLRNTKDDQSQQEVGESALIPILVKAIQELSQEIKDLKNG